MGICGSVLWGIVSCFVGDIAKCCTGCLPRDLVVKVMYMVIAILVIAPAIALFYAVQNWDTFVTYFSKYINCPGTHEYSASNSASAASECRRCTGLVWHY